MDALRERQARATRLAIELAGDGAPALDALRRAGIEAVALAGHGVQVETGDGYALRALETLRAAGVAVRTFELQRPTLEEIFLGVVRGERHES
jgi:predicted Fe-Mo cluster-binding NifX family protein